MERVGWASPAGLYKLGRELGIHRPTPSVKGLVEPGQQKSSDVPSLIYS